MDVFFEKWRRLPSRAVYALLSLLSLVFMIWRGNFWSFWLDEFAQICYSGLDNTLLDTILITDPTPPFFSAVANIWYDVVPYGERWLLLLPQLAAVLGIYVAALWGEQLGGRRAGIWTALLMAFSEVLVPQCGFEFRGYGFYLLFAALTFYLHQRLLERGMEKAGRLNLFFTLSLLGLLYTHIFAALIFFALATQDMVLMLRRRLPFGRIFTYFFSGLFYLPWALNFLINAGEAALASTSSWMHKAGLLDIPVLVAYFCGNHILVCLLFAAGALAVLQLLMAARKKKEGSMELAGKLVPFLTAAFVIMAVFAYGKLRPDNESLWVKRYFMGLYPCAAVVCGLGAAWLRRLAEKKSSDRAALICELLCVLLIVPLWLSNMISGNIPIEMLYHRESTEILYQQPDIHDENTLVLCTFDLHLEGWEEYYCEQQGRREGLGLQSVFRVTEEELLQYDVVYLEYGYGDEESQDTECRRALEEDYTADKIWEDISLIRYIKNK